MNDEADDQAWLDAMNEAYVQWIANKKKEIEDQIKLSADEFIDKWEQHAEKDNQ